MLNRVLHRTLQILLVLAIVLILAVQTLFLPWLSGELAVEYPEASALRAPLLALSVLGLACVQIALVCTLRLLAFTRCRAIFTDRALPWVNGIIGAFVAGGVVCLVTLAYQLSQQLGPPLWLLMLLAGGAAGAGLAMLMLVMRSLLVQATALRTELDEVI